jgi:hypothetical protein
MRTALATLLLVHALGASSALAQEAPPPADDTFQSAAARALFQEGVALAHSGDYAGAADRFRRAQQLRPAPSVAFNLASALVRQGSLVEASEILEGVLRDPASSPELLTSARRARDELVPRIARLTLRVDGPSAGVRVEIDAHPLSDAAIGVSLPVDPGLHEVLALRDGEVAARDRVELTEGENRELALVVPPPVFVPETIFDMEPSPPPASPPPPASDDALWIALTTGIIVVVGAAAATTAIVLTLPSGPPAFSGNTSPPVLTW